MSKLNMKEWINEIIQKKEMLAMTIMTHPGIEKKGKTVREAVTHGDKRNYPKERGGGYAHHDPSGHRDDRENGARCGY